MPRSKADPSAPAPVVASARPDRSAEALYDLGRQAWPTLELSPQAFASQVAARPQLRGADPAHAADVYLACACLAHVEGAAAAFDRVHLTPVREFIAKLRPSPALVDEVRQAVREKLLIGTAGSPARLEDYDGVGSLGSWVRVTALRTAIDLQRRGQRGLVAAEPPAHSSADGDAEIGHIKEIYRGAFNEAFRHALRALDSGQRSLLRRHYVAGVTLDALADELGVHRATVARRLAATRQSLFERARQRLGEQLGTSEPELESLVRLMRSQIELTLTGLLDSEVPPGRGAP